MQFALLPALESCPPSVLSPTLRKETTEPLDGDGVSEDGSPVSCYRRERSLVSSLGGCLIKDASPHLLLYDDSFSFSAAGSLRDETNNEDDEDQIEFEITKAYDEKHDCDATASTSRESDLSGSGSGTAARATLSDDVARCSSPQEDDDDSSLRRRLFLVNHSRHSVRGHHVFLDDPSASSSSRLEDDVRRARRNPRHRVRDRRDDPADHAVDDDDLATRLTTHPLLAEVDAVRAEIRRTDEEVSALHEDVRTYGKQLTYLEESSGLLVSWDPDDHETAPATPKKKRSTTMPSFWGKASRFSRRQRRDGVFSRKTKRSLTGALNEPSTATTLTSRKQRGLFLEYEIFFNNAAPRRVARSRAALESFASHTRRTSRVRKVSDVALVGESDFFLTWDSGRNTWHGEMPNNLRRRLDDGGRGASSSNVTYVAVGPRFGDGDDDKSESNRYYYVETSDDEGWWVNFDPDFHRAVRTMPVHRVAFGEPYPGSEGAPSWIVLAKDGRAAWKGVPSHLHVTLSTRDPSLCCACEVSLGPSGSYFVKFLNGEIDYCLPAAMANRCEEVERLGGVVTNVLLHVDCVGFIMRHTATKKKKEAR